MFGTKTKRPTLSSLPLRLVRRLGGTANLHLRGSVLVLDQSMLGMRSSMFVPVEWVTVTRGTRRRTTGWSTALVALVLSAATLGGLYCVIALTQRWETAQLSLKLALFAGWAASLWVPVAALKLLPRHAPTAALIIETADGVQHLEFWHAADRDPALEAVLAKIEQVEKRPKNIVPNTIETTYTARTSTVFLLELAKATFIALLAFVPVALLALYLEQPSLALLGTAPFGFYLGKWIVDWVGWRMTPPSVRRTLRSLGRGDSVAARDHVAEALETMPDSIETVVLAVQVDIENSDFDRAMQRCRHVARLDPDVADGLMEEIWDCKRIHDRMHVDL